MGIVQWNDNLSVGVELIDEHHKVLIQHLNNLTTAIESQQGPAKIVNTLEFLIDYTNFHFSTEEKSMTENDYPGLEHHLVQHAEFKTALSNLEEDFKEEGATTTLADSIDKLLVNWFIKHIQEVDLRFGAFLKEKGIDITEN